MGTKLTMKTADGDIKFDSQVLLKRLVIDGTHVDKFLDALRYELCALFESKHALLVANKPFWRQQFGTCHFQIPTGQMVMWDTYFMVAPSPNIYRGNWETCTMQFRIATEMIPQQKTSHIEVVFL